MTKKIMWAAIIIAAIIYTVVVYNWWQEGNRNFESNRQDTIFRH